MGGLMAFDMASMKPPASESVKKFVDRITTDSDYSAYILKMVQEATNGRRSWRDIAQEVAFTPEQLAMLPSDAIVHESTTVTTATTATTSVATFTPATLTTVTTVTIVFER